MTQAKKTERRIQMAPSTACDERHKFISISLRIIGGGVIAALSGLGGLYLYANSSFAAQTEIISVRDEMKDIRRELRQEIRDGFTRLEQRISESRR